MDAPLIWQYPGEEMIHYFQYWQIKLWDVPVEDLQLLELPGLLPLSILAKGGKQLELIEQTCSKLWQKQEKVLLAMALSFASMVLKSAEEATWLEGVAQMYEDFVSDTWYYQRILSKGEQKGLEKGVEQGMRDMLLNTIQMRFPVLLQGAQDQLETVKSPDLLRRLNAGIIQAQSVEEAKHLLLEIMKDVPDKPGH